VRPEHLDLLRRCDRYLDAAPRAASEPSDVGTLRVFLSRAPWPYYARPRPELDLTAPGAVDRDDIEGAAQRLAALGHDVSFEWVEELVPSLRPALTAHGYAVRLHPLLALDLPAPPALLTAPARVQLARTIDAASPHLRAALAVAEVAFREPGVGPAGPLDRDAAEVTDAQADFLTARIAEGSAAFAVVVDPVDGVVSTGSHVPVDGLTEIMGVATLPSHRRRGLAADIVTTLVVDATARGCTLALLSATDDDVARVYERVGFVRIGHTGAAHPIDTG
jgi:GNAT superfamily N-acetyltransferase